MTDDYQLRKELDNYKWLFDELTKELSRQGVINISELLDKFYDQSEVDVHLTKLSDDLTSLYSTLEGLRGSLIDFNGELISFDEDNTNLSSDLSKLKDNLHNFIVAVNTLSSDLKGLDESLDGLGEDLFGDDSLSTQLNALTTVVGDANSGLVKSLNTLQGTVGNNSGGLVKELNDLTGSVTQLSTDVFGEDGLSSQVSGLAEDVFGEEGLSSQVSSLEEDVFGEDGLSSRIGTAEGSLSTLVDSLDTLSGFLTAFEDELSDFEDELEENNIDVSELNPTITALFGAITIVKGNVTSVQGDLSDVSDSFDDVKGDLYGTKTVDGQTVPKEPTDTPSANSFKGKTDAVKSDLYGTKTVNGQTVPKEPSDTPSTTSFIGKTNAVKSDLYGTKTVNGQTVPKEPTDTPSDGSLSKTLSTVDNTINSEGGLIDQLGDVSDNIDDTNGVIFGTDQQGNPLSASDTPTANSFIGKTNAVKSDLYGTKTVNGVTVPKEPTDTASTTSVKGRLKTVQETDIPAVQDILYGDGDEGNPADGSVLGDIYNVDTGLAKAHEHIGNIQDMSYGASDTYVENGVTKHYDINNPSPTSVMGRIDTAEGGIIDAQGDIIDIQGDIGTVPTGKTLQGQITDMQEGYTFMDTNLNFLFIPSTNFEYVFCFSHEADNQTFLTASSDYNFPISLINYGYTGCSLGTYHENVRNGSSWSSGSISTSKTIIGVGLGYQLGIANNEWTLRPPSTIPFNLFYDIEKKTYLTISETNSLSVKWRAITDYKDFYKYTDIFDAMDNDFTRKGHTHSMSNIDGLTNSLNAKANVSHTHSQSEITGLSNALNEKSNSSAFDFELVQQIDSNGSPEVYANEYEVYIKLSGSVSLSANTNSIIGTIEEPYRPFFGYEYGLINHTNANIYGAVKDTGELYIINKTTTTSTTVYGSIRYPRKSTINVPRSLTMTVNKSIMQTGDTNTISVTAKTKSNKSAPNKVVMIYAEK